LSNFIFPPLRGILFDKDGTLLNLEALWTPAAEQTIDHVLCRCDCAFLREECLLAVGIKDGITQPEGPLVAGTNGDVAAAIESVLLRYGFAPEADFTDRVSRLLTGLASGEAANVLPTCSDLPAVLRRLRQGGLVLGIATSDRPESALLHLKKLGIADAFSFFGTDDGTRRPKPAPDLMNAFCAQFGFSPSECAVVGDAPNDMRFAANSHSHGIIILRSGMPLPPGAQASVRSLSELPALLLN